MITTLGRDGSDLTATVIGAATKASEVQIWKDVSGVQTTDPRVISAAKPVAGKAMKLKGRFADKRHSLFSNGKRSSSREVHVLTFEEAAELSTFGSKVVHPAAVLPAWSAGVPMSVKNSMAPDLPGALCSTWQLAERWFHVVGTRIVPELGGQDTREGRVAAISSKKNITMIVACLKSGFGAKLILNLAWDFCRGN